MSERIIKTPIRYYFDNIMERVKRKNMKTKLQMIIKILTRKKVVLLTEECKGIHQMTFAGCDVIEANRIKNLKYNDA